jgi:hypothetical protein
MSDKIAVVIDTNFIINHISDLREVHQKLSESYVVFVTDISIQERLSQKYLELKSRYEKIEKFRNENKDFVTVQIKKPFEERYEFEKAFTQKGYQEEFSNNIIGFNPSKNNLNLIMDRVYKKIGSSNFCVHRWYV